MTYPTLYEPVDLTGDQSFGRFTSTREALSYTGFFTGAWELWEVQRTEGGCWTKTKMLKEHCPIRRVKIQ